MTLHGIDFSVAESMLAASPGKAGIFAQLHNPLGPRFRNRMRTLLWPAAAVRQTRLSFLLETLQPLVSGDSRYVESSEQLGQRVYSSCRFYDKLFP